MKSVIKKKAQEHNAKVISSNENRDLKKSVEKHDDEKWKNCSLSILISFG